MNLIQKNLALSALKVIGTDNIAKMISTIISTILEKKQSIPLEPGETKIVGMIYDQDEKMFFSTVAVSETETDISVKRFINVFEVKDLVSIFLKELE